jgi:hypothetical protein
MAKVMLSVTTGNENQKDGQCAFHLFYVQNDGRELFAAKAAYLTENQPYFRMVGQPMTEPSVIGYRKEMCGRWSTMTFEAEEGVILKVFAKRKPRWNALINQACMYLKVRADGPKYNILMDTLQVLGKSQRTNVGITGRFDILPIHEVKQERPIAIAPALERLFLESSINSVFRIEELEKEKTQRQVIESKELLSPNGEKVVVKTRKKIRAIEI